MKPSKKLMLAFFTLALADYSTAAIYNSNNGHYYQLVEGDWFQAKARAEQLGGYLTTIGSQEEQTWLLNKFGSSELYWIGLTDEANEGDFKWVNGEPLAYSNWYADSGEPNNASFVVGGEDYVVMNWQSESGAWNDLGPGYLFGEYPSAWYDVKYGIAEIDAPAVPVPASAWLFVSSLAGVIGIKRKSYRTR